MRSVRNLGRYPAGRQLPADEVTEFHAGRILLLLHEGGGRIQGLTKFAKLDFFVRYPAFFARACAADGRPAPRVPEAVESPMVRYHYGPWDARYHNLLAFLEARELLRVGRTGPRTFYLELTEEGRSLATRLGDDDSFRDLRWTIIAVHEAFGNMTGDALRHLVYRVFDREVARRRLGEEIGS